MTTRRLFCVAALGMPALTRAAIDDQPMSMQVTPVAFQKRFNDAAVARKLEFRINGSPVLKPTTEIADQWVYQFTNRIGFAAMVNKKDGTIRSFTYLAGGDGTLQSGIDLSVVLMAFIAAVDPSLEKATSAKLGMRLMDSYKSPKGVEEVRNGIRYGAVVLQGVGIMVAINPVQA